MTFYEKFSYTGFIVRKTTKLKKKMEKKYKLIDEGNWKRLVALKSFGDVKEGDLGGLVKSEDNLSHEGDCWIYDEAKAYGNARVYGNAKVYGYAQVFGKAKVYGNAIISEYARIFDTSEVYRNAQVYGQIRIHGNFYIGDDIKIGGKGNIFHG